ncbi:MAG: hypothetical protein IJ551_03490 [Prevotella sp.]|nr:hypothetical protein [Prevotella sp.]
MRKFLLSFALLLSALIAQAQPVPTVITEQPAGTLKSYLRSGSYIRWYLDEPYNQDGKMAQMVWADDGQTVYLQSPVTGYSTNAWIKGTVSSDGKKLTFPAGQYIEYDEDEEYGVQVFYIKDIVVDEWGDAEDYTVDTETDITFTVSGKTISLDGTSEKVMLGLVYDDTEEWTENYNAEFGTVLTEFDEVAVTAPEGLETQVYSMESGGHETHAINIVNLGFSGSDVYVLGLSHTMPSAVLKGTLGSDGVVTFPSKVFAGLHNGTPKYWMAANATWAYDDYWEEYRYSYALTDNLQFTLDSEKKTLSIISPEPGTVDATLLLNGGTTRVYYLDVFEAPELLPFTEVVATPQDPVITRHEEYEEGVDEEWGPYSYEGQLRWRGRYFDVDGNIINPDKVSYQLYIDDDQPYALKADLYEDLKEDMQEVPAIVSLYDIYGYDYGTHTIYLLESGYERIGVQAIYRGAGVERRSNIVYSDGTTSGYLSGIHKLTSADGSARTEYFDLQGRRIQTAKPGQLVIRRTVSADGAVKTTKVLR